MERSSKNEFDKHVTESSAFNPTVWAPRASVTAMKMALRKKRYT
jgi:hypothetical protein